MSTENTPVWVLCDDRWHPGQVVIDGLRPLESAGYAFKFSKKIDRIDLGTLRQYPVVILSKSNNTTQEDLSPWATEAVQQAFDDYVSEGGRLLVLHSGTASYQDEPILRKLIGGVFVQHPEQCLVSLLPKGSHPITEGFQAFTEKDEHYFMEKDDPEAVHFLEAKSEHGSETGGWTRKHGKGKVCVLTPGHNLPVWLHPEYQKLLNQSLRWCLA